MLERRHFGPGPCKKVTGVCSVVRHTRRFRWPRPRAARACHLASHIDVLRASQTSSKTCSIRPCRRAGGRASPRFTPILMASSEKAHCWPMSPPVSLPCDTAGITCITAFRRSASIGGDTNNSGKHQRPVRCKRHHRRLDHRYPSPAHRSPSRMAGPRCVCRSREREAYAPRPSCLTTVREVIERRLRSTTIDATLDQVTQHSGPVGREQPGREDHRRRRRRDSRRYSDRVLRAHARNTMFT
jgi:hypothetical protein